MGLPDCVDRPRRAHLGDEQPGRNAVDPDAQREEFVSKGRGGVSYGRLRVHVREREARRRGVLNSVM